MRVNGAEVQCEVRDARFPVTRPRAARGINDGLVMGEATRLEARAQGAPCVFTTGYSDAAIPPEFADAPYFKKPINIDHVINAVAMCVKIADR